ncbi:hypothetical protein ACFSTJ_04990 [Ottowia pentelensis]
MTIDSHKRHLLQWAAAGAHPLTLAACGKRMKPRRHPPTSPPPPLGRGTH